MFSGMLVKLLTMTQLFRSDNYSIRPKHRVETLPNNQLKTHKKITFAAAKTITTQ